MLNILIQFLIGLDYIKNVIQIVTPDASSELRDRPYNSKRYKISIVYKIHLYRED